MRKTKDNKTRITWNMFDRLEDLEFADNILRKTKDNKTRITWNMFDRLEDLEFADNICLVTSTKKQIQAKSLRLPETAQQKQIQAKSLRLPETAQQVGLKINTRKTKLLIPHENDEDHREIDGKRIEEVKEFCCLGSTLGPQGGTELKKSKSSVA
ncbi:hypothetical protein QE152_g28438 [Popillia japonica]|uniref:Reverse transcriptase domain-containing protein n=1 Tax=Popillia japonica TaxID=7064 RepID=A0AAW1JJV3_POPJA